MIEWIITSCALIVIVLLVRLALKGRISLRLQYALWLLVLVRLLIPVNFLSSPMSVMNAVPEPAPTVQEAPQQVTTPVLPDPELPEQELPQVTPSLPAPQQTQQPATPVIPQTTPADVQPTPEPAKTISLTPEQILVGVWVLGMAATCIIILAANVRFALRLKRSRQKESAHCRLSVYSTRIIDTPCLFGIFRPAIYLTADALDDDQRTHVLTHELTHWRHWDHIWALLRSACLVLHWYNPLVWIAAILSRRDAELACDEATIQQLGEDNRTQYGKTLICMTCAKQDLRALLTTATTMTGSKKTITQRIRLIAKHPKTAAYAVILLILVAAIAVGCTFTGAKPEESAQTTFTTPEELPFNADEQEFWFASGAGAWASILELNKDGSFTGNYHNTEPGITGQDYPNGTRYHSTFWGNFEIIEQPNDYSIVLQLSQVQTEQPADEVSFEDGMRIITTNAFGIDGGSRFILYLPNATIEQIPEEGRTWLPPTAMKMKNDEQLGFYYLYNKHGETGFFSFIDQTTKVETVVVTDKPASEMLTKSYSLKDLRAFMDDEEMFYTVYSSHPSGRKLSLSDVHDKFPIECVKGKYIVYSVEEGGYFYVFMDIWEAYEVGEQVVLSSTNVNDTMYVSGVCDLSDFDSIEVGESTYQDVKDIDPNIRGYYSSDDDYDILRSNSPLSDGRLLNIRYERNDDTNSEVVVDIQINPINDEPAPFWWSRIQYEDWPIDSADKFPAGNTEANDSVYYFIKSKTVTFTDNEQWQLITELNEKGFPKTCTFTYNGKVIEEGTFQFADNLLDTYSGYDTRVEVTSLYKYNSFGDLTAKKAYNGDFVFTDDTYVYTYDTNGNRLTENRFSGGDDMSLSTCTYDSYGNILTSEYDSADKYVTCTRNYQYDDAGNILKVELKWSTSPGPTYYIFEYDQGRLVRRTDELGTITVYTYDDNGRIVEEAVTTAEGVYHTFSFEYDKLGRVVKTTCTTDGVVMNYIEYSYHPVYIKLSESQKELLIHYDLIFYPEAEHKPTNEAQPYFYIGR